MAASGKSTCDLLHEEFQKWQEENSSIPIFLLEAVSNEDDSVTLLMIIGTDSEFRLHCPIGYSSHVEHFYVEADPSVKLWANTLNEFLLDSPDKLTLAQVLSKASSLFTNDNRKFSEEDEEHMSLDEDEEEEDDGGLILSDDDSAFTTEWELQVARKKKKWHEKEQELREEMKKACMTPGGCSGNLTSSNLTTFHGMSTAGMDQKAAKQIFTSSAASGILTNDLVKIMESEQNVGFVADPVSDNIYQWSVKLYNFEENSDLHSDLREVEAKFGYCYIELHLDFAIDLYPFYPPLVKVIRPRLQASMMQRVPNMEMLKLSYWNPTKDMLNVIVDIKAFLQQWARLEVHSERNDRKRYPDGSYVDIEHHLLRLALVSEVNPRVNSSYQLHVKKPHESSLPSSLKGKLKRKKEEYWAAGTGYGHSKRPEWDIKAYLAAQKEKDKQVESVLHKILHELKVLYAQHAPQLKPRTVPCPPREPDIVDPVEDMYCILEGSALIPFLELYLKVDSFLEICRHTSVYKVIVDITKEIAMQPQLVPLLGTLSGQPQSIYQLISVLEQKASVLLQHICKAGNGSIPKPAKKETSKKSKDRSHNYHDDEPTSSADLLSVKTAERTAEEKLAREFQVLFKDITEAFKRVGMSPNGEPEEAEVEEPVPNTEVMDISLVTDENALIESRYKKVIEPLQFDSCDIDLEGPNSHHYASDFKKAPKPSQSQVFRIAQELSSLSSSLPLDLSSCICVRTDEDKLVMMRALITGYSSPLVGLASRTCEYYLYQAALYCKTPNLKQNLVVAWDRFDCKWPEGTPYSGGCYLFDIYFPSTYPKTPPMVNLQTTGGGTVRFNPNLYNCGKVCLSLLGTWEGQQGEQWNETTSTVLQVLVSIQSLILVPEPYFNEPGYEQEIGTEAGARHSAEYNADVHINSIKHAMISQLQNPSPGFEEMIWSHFYIKRDRILKEVDTWVANSKSSKLERAAANLRTALMKLQPPPNAANICASESLLSTTTPQISEPPHTITEMETTQQNEEESSSQV